MLRRRTGKDDAPSHDDNDNDNDNKSRPRLNRIQTEEDELRAEFDGAKVKQLVIRPRSKRRNGFIFVLGGLFGIFIALFFANQQEVISLDSLMDLNLDSLIDVIPQGIVRDAKAFSVRSLAQRRDYLAALCLRISANSYRAILATRTRSR
jgi:phospholipid:diacylglycerol acyltransferase